MCPLAAVTGGFGFNEAPATSPGKFYKTWMAEPKVIVASMRPRRIRRGNLANNEGAVPVLLLLQ